MCLKKDFKKIEKIYEVLGIFNPQRFKEYAKNPHLSNNDNLKFIARKSNAESGIALKEEFLQFISFFNHTFDKCSHKSNIEPQSLDDSSVESSDNFETISCWLEKKKAALVVHHICWNICINIIYIHLIFRTYT